MIKNTHKLRQQIDDPKGFLLHCLAELDELGVTETRLLNQDVKKRETLLEQSANLETVFVEIQGAKGTHLFRGYFDTVCRGAYNLNGHAYSDKLLIGEHTDRMEDHVFSLKVVVGRLLLASITNGKVLTSMTSGDTPLEPSVGMVWGNPSETYYTFIHVTEAGIRLELRETEVNPHNAGSEIKTLVKPTPEELQTYGINVRKFAEDLRQPMHLRTSTIL